MMYSVESKKGNKYTAIAKYKTLNQAVRSVHFFTKIRTNTNNLRLAGYFIFIDKDKMIDKNGAFYFVCNQRRFKLKNNGSSPRPIRFLWMVFLRHDLLIPYQELSDADIHNKIYISHERRDGNGFSKIIKYNFIDFSHGKKKNRGVQVLPQDGTTIFMRQGAANQLYITVRRTIVSDEPRNQRLITIAWIAAKLTWWRRGVLLYEKESLRYEEGASILYEELLKKGYGNFFYVIDKKSEQYQLIDKKYHTNLLYKNTLRHYYHFFLAKYYIGTELPSHSIDLRIANRKVVSKLENNRYEFIFLQHGVSYMVSYASRPRSAFRKSGGILPDNSTRVVVNSELEASHFIDHADFDKEDMLITGFPKFDRAYRYHDAQKIIIMPTWRPWEYNAIRSNPESTRYYKMLLDIIDSIPSELQQYVQLLPHPLFIRELRESPLATYIKEVVSYDEVLRTADVLITDYSSISYDAFYRGSKVIFWWKEKNYCMKQYEGFLMLEESSAFGDVVYNKRDLKKAIRERYGKAQPQKYIQRYRKIVNFHDGKNTERLINQLVSDGIIE